MLTKTLSMMMTKHHIRGAHERKRTLQQYKVRCQETDSIIRTKFSSCTESIMRSIAIALIFFSHSLVQYHYAQCSEVHHPEGSALGHHLNIIRLHQIIRRQVGGEMPTAAPTDEYCNSFKDSILNDALCSSGAAQRLADNDLRCGESLENVRSEYSTCARNENGGFCGSLAILNGALDGRLRLYSEGNCSETFASDTCLPQCRSHLEDLKSILGCCIDEYINREHVFPSSVSLIRSSNYHLWNLCDVPPPPMHCKHHGLTFYQPSTIVQNCTSLGDSSPIAFMLLCQSKYWQVYIDDLLTVKESRCSQIFLKEAENTVIDCTITPDGEFCGELVQHGNYRNFISVLDSNCDQEIENATACRSTCRDELVEIKDALGCCVNFYNRSLTSMPVSESLAYTVWKSCGVETPGFCESTLTLGVSISMATKTVHNHATSIYHTYQTYGNIKRLLITILVIIFVHNLGL